MQGREPVPVPGGATSSGDEAVADARRWSRVKALFLEAIDQPENRRSEFLALACGDDDALLREVESLLQSDRAAGTFCETPAAQLLADPSSVAAALDGIRRRNARPRAGPPPVAVRRRRLLWPAGLVLGGVAMLLAGAGLWQWGGDGRPSPMTTMALLPLVNATGDPAEQHYVDGVTEALNAQLSAADDVRIISPASVSLVARTAKTHVEIADRLGVSLMVEGSVRRVADQVLVDIWLVRPADGRVMWAERFQRPADEVLALQADVVRAVVLGVGGLSRARVGRP